MAATTPIDVRSEFLDHWLQLLATTRFSSNGEVMMIDLAIDGLEADLTADQILTILGHVSESTSYPSEVSLTGLSIEGYAVTEVFLSFKEGKITFIFIAPLNLVDLRNLEDRLDQNGYTALDVEIELSQKGANP